MPLAVAAVIFPRGNTALDDYLAAFGEVAAAELGLLPPAHDRYVVRRCVLVFARHLNGEIEARHRSAARCVSEFGFLSQTAQKSHMVKH